MPHKNNHARRHKFSKPKYRVTNWSDYNAALQQRGSLTIWFTEEAQAGWLAVKTGKRGAQPVYSDLAIETSLTLRLVFKQPLRQTTGLLRSLTAILKLDELPIPNYSTLSRRGQRLKVSLKVKRAANQPLHILVDSSGLKIYGEGEWLQQKHGAKSRRRWRKLHIALDAETHQMVAIELTTDEVGDPTVVPDLLAQTKGEIASFTADGAYDGDSLYHAIANHQPDVVDVIIPPRSTSVLSEQAATQPTARDRHIQGIADLGRMGWQRESGYNRRSLVENSFYRYKTIIGRRLHTRNLSNQQTEAKLGCAALNRMTQLGMPASQMVG
ncbi:MAG TPA: IS5 family transposase [Methylococcaceae bacterium]|nr:IS5 family transposase [Methylococcaceae bacterium]